MGDLLNGVPRSSKETWIIVFYPGVFTHLSGYVGLSEFAFLSKLTTSGFVGLSGFTVFYGISLSVLTNLSFLKR